MFSNTVEVTSVAFDVGYESPSAFTAMFRRAFGEPPSIYLSHSPADEPSASPTAPHS
ncbi:MAG: helix-turn-helix domain-containing protein, partial [Rhodanobacteraceae bacterium]